MGRRGVAGERRDRKQAADSDHILKSFETFGEILMLYARAGLAAILLAVWASPAGAAAPPDCSAMKIPDTPVKGTVNGKPFVPNAVTVHVTRNGFGMNEYKFDTWELAVQTGGIFNEMTVTFLVKAGTKPTGKTFRVLPTDSISGQPFAAPGVPEVQGWDLELEAAGVDTSFTQDTASIRLELGKDAANMIPGRIYFCVPSVNATIMGTFNARFVQ
jgi:hypothetical protein